MSPPHIKYTILGEPWVPSADPFGSSSRGLSQLGAALRCDTLWHLGYQDRLRPIHSKKHTNFGSCFHVRKQFRNARKMIRPPKWLSMYDEEEVVTQVAGTHHQNIKASKKIERLHEAYWKNLGREWTIFSAEEEVYASLGEMFPQLREQLGDLATEVVTARIDLTAELPDGSLIWIDYKTTGGDYRYDRLHRWNANQNEYQRSAQALASLRVARAHYLRRGKALEDFWIERVRSVETFESDRHPVSISKEAYFHAGRALIQAVKKEFVLAKRRAKGLPDRQTGILRGACQTNWGPCDLWSLCQAAPEQREQIVKLSFSGK